MYNMIVPVVADLDVLEAQFCQDLLPGVAVDEGRGVHHSSVSNDEDVLSALLGHGEVSVLQSHHSCHQVLLEVQYLNYRSNRNEIQANTLSFRKDF